MPAGVQALYLHCQMGLLWSNVLYCSYMLLGLAYALLTAARLTTVGAFFSLNACQPYDSRNSGRGGVQDREGVAFVCREHCCVSPSFPCDAHVLQLGARPKDSSASPGGRSSPLGDAAKVAAKPEVLYPYASGSGLGNRTLDLLAEARSRGAAVGAFTVYSLEGIRAVVRAAEATGRSAILQVQYGRVGCVSSVCRHMHIHTQLF